MKNKYMLELEKLYSNLDFSEFEYINENNIGTIKCPIHGKFKDSYIGMKVYKNNCPKCYAIPRSRRERLYSLHKIINHLKINNFNNIIINIDNYLVCNRDEKVKFKCNIHGDFTSSLRLLSRCSSNPCPKCRNKQPEEYLNDLKSKFPDLIFEKFEYAGYYKESVVVCPKHGEFLDSYYRLSNPTTLYGCKECGIEGRSISKIKPSNVDKLKTKYPNLDFSKFEYKNKKEESIIICPTHGEFYSTCDRLLRKDVYIGCPKCKTDMFISKAESEIRDFIKTFYSGAIEFNNRELINPYEIDFYLPELSLAFEYNGIYWHSDKVIRRSGKFNSAEEYHNFKREECSKKGVDLYHISEEDFVSNKDKVLDFIKNKINSRN